MPTLVSLPCTTPTDDVLEVLARDGCVILDRLADTATMDAVGDLAPDIASTPTAPAIRRHKTTHAHGPGQLARLRAVPRFIHHRGASTMLCRAPTAAATSSPPLPRLPRARGAMQELHRDDCSILSPIRREQQSVVTVIGRSRISRRLTGRPGGADAAIAGTTSASRPWRGRAAEMSRGSAVYILAPTYHAGGANRATEPRSGLLYGYCLGWLRQEQNQYLAVPPDIARTLPEPLQRLIGYAVHEPFLGWHDLQDPIELLRGYEDQSAGARDLNP